MAVEGPQTVHVGASVCFVLCSEGVVASTRQTRPWRYVQDDADVDSAEISEAAEDVGPEAVEKIAAAVEAAAVETAASYAGAGLEKAAPLGPGPAAAECAASPGDAGSSPGSFHNRPWACLTERQS